MKIKEYHPFKSAKAKEAYLSSYEERVRKYWPIESEERLLETSFGKTFVRVSGEDGKPPLVLLPGGNNSSLMWWQNIESLSLHFKTYAIDNIADFGKSIPVKDIKKPEEFAHWLNELFDVLGLGDGINLAGLSYGGWVACLYAQKFQSRLHRLVLLAPAATVLPLCREFWLRVICSVLIPHPYFTRGLIHWLCEDMCGKDDASRAILSDAVDDLYSGIRAFTPRKLPIPTVLSDDELQAIQVPTLYLVGENEKIYPAVNAARRLKTAAPAITAEIIPGAGHDLVFVEPEITNRKIIEFLQ